MTTGDETKPTDTGSTPGATEAPADDEGGAGDTAAALLESAAEIAIGAAVAPFTGGETVGIVASLTEAIEGGVDRLTHLGAHHEAAPEDAEATETGGRQDPPA